jgi:glutamine synthetase
MISEKNIALMSEMNVLSPVEVQSRYEVELEHYSKVINIEALTTLGMARRQLIPAALDFMSSVANTAAAKQAVSDKISVKTEEQILTYVSRDTDDMCAACDKLEELMNKVDTIEGTYELAEYYCKTILPTMDEVRAAADHCEIIVGKDYWPLPSYSDMLFYV